MYVACRGAKGHDHGVAIHKRLCLSVQSLKKWRRVFEFVGMGVRLDRLTTGGFGFFTTNVGIRRGIGQTLLGRRPLSNDTVLQVGSVKEDEDA